MTVEKTIFVNCTTEMVDEFTSFRVNADAAIRRSAKLPPGSSASEIARFESLSTFVEQRAIAIAASGNGEVIIDDTRMYKGLPASLLNLDALSKSPEIFGTLPSGVQNWINAGSSVVVCQMPHFQGPTPRSIASEHGPGPTSSKWKASTRNRKMAVTERFDAQIVRALTNSKQGIEAINPSGISNRVLTETLRRYVTSTSDAQRVDVPVVYRDGSSAEAFPFRALAMTEEIPSKLPKLRFTLLSIRHVEMDELVDGAWFRNARISVPRPAGLTDSDAFEISTRQLCQIRSMGPAVIEMYQTGLEAPIMGFYRAVALELLEHPGSIFVVPKFFVHSNDFEEGTVWGTV